MGLIEREPMIRAIRDALDRHEHEHADNDGRAVAALLAVEPLLAEQLRGVVEENERLKKEGAPGVMHAVDKAFYDLAIKERDYERVRSDRLEAERDDLLRQLTR